MHDAFDRSERIVGDRIGALVRLLVDFALIGHELPRNGIVWIVTIDQIGHRRRDSDRIARGDLGKGAKLVARNERLLAKRVDGAHCGRRRFHASGFHKTCSMRAAPVASMTRRSSPSAMPQACGIAAKAARKSSSIG